MMRMKSHRYVTVQCLCVIMLTMGHSSHQQTSQCEPGDIPQWPNDPGDITIMPIETEDMKEGQHFLIVNKPETHDLLQIIDGDRSNEPMHDKVEHAIRDFDRADQYLSSNITKSCRISPTDDVCVGIAIAMLPWLFLEVFRAYPEPGTTELEIAPPTRRTEGSCNFGQFTIQNLNNPADQTAFCRLNHDAPDGLPAYTMKTGHEYVLSFEVAEPSPNSDAVVMFAVPLSANGPVRVQCGRALMTSGGEGGTDTPSFDGIPPGRPTDPLLTETNTSPTPRPKKEKDNKLSPAFIALIAVVAAVFLAAVVLSIFLFLYCRRKPQKETSSIENGADTRQAFDNYEQVDLTLAKDNPYQPDPTIHTYERVNSHNSQRDRTSYAEIPADAIEGGETNSQYQSILQTDSQSNGSAPPLPPANMAAVNNRDHNQSEASQISENTNQSKNIEELYARPNKPTKQPDELIENDVYQSGSKKEKTGDAGYETLKPRTEYNSTTDNQQKEKLQQQGSILRIVDNDVNSSD